MIHAYSADYLMHAQQTLGGMLLAGVYLFDVPSDEFWSAFISTGYAARFGKGEAGVVAGLSGWELAVRVLEKAGRPFEKRRPIAADTLPPPYWAGWALAKYQWYTGLSFECIESVIPVSSVIDLYHPYHEMDVKRFFRKLDDLYLAKYPDTNLRRIRRAANISRADLARIAEVSPRMIGKYESREKDINHAQSDVVARLAVALHVTAADLYERVIPNNDYTNFKYGG